ncbi:MAG: AI-2E family transporter [Candidatus Kerfeldbacteria bacterium]
MALRKEKKNNEEVLRVTISASTVIKIVAILAGLAFIWFIRDIVGILFVALVLASALDPWVDWLQRYRIPRGLSILLMYTLILVVVGAVVYILIPPFINQITDLAASLRDYAPELDAFYQSITQTPDASVLNEIQRSITSFSSSLTNLTSGVFSAVANIFGGIATLFIVLVITFYMTIDEEGVKKFIRSVAPVEYQPYLVQKVNRIQKKMGSWLRGQLILMLIIGVLSFIGLFILQVPYALVLACVAGLAEFVPFLGPIIAAVPAVFFAYTDSPWKALGVIIFYTVLQQLENQVIVPKIMQRVVGLNPIVVLSVMLVGASIAGIVGVLLAVPAATIAWIFIEDIFLEKKKRDVSLEPTTGEINQ